MTPRFVARTAGALYLLVILAGMFAEFFVRSTLVVRDDAAATAAKIAASEQLFRLGFVADLAAAAAYLGVSFLLFVLLRRVSNELAVLSLVLGTAGSVVMAANLANLFAALAAVKLGAAPASGALQLQALVSLRLHGTGYSISAVFFGAHLFTLAALILRSGFMPRFLGLLLALAGPAWLVYTLVLFLSPPASGYLFPYVPLLSLVAEGALALWLLLGRVPESEGSTAARA
jgi:hypothetical protein